MSAIHEFLLYWGFRYLPVPSGEDSKYTYEGIEVTLRACPSPIAEYNSYKLVDRLGNVVAQIPFGYSQLTGYCLLGVRLGRPIFCGFIHDGKKHGIVEDFPTGRQSYMARYNHNEIVSVLFRLSRESNMFCEITLDGNLLYVETVNDKKMINGVRYEYVENHISRAYDIDDNYEKMSFDGDIVTVYNSRGSVLYKGQYLDNVYIRYCYHGQGELFLTGGLVYKGSFAYGKRDGMGELYRNKVLIYKGNWKDNAPEGQGTLYNSDGSVLFQGRFNRGFYESIPQNFVHYLKPDSILWDSRSPTSPFSSSSSSSSSLKYKAQPENWWNTGAVRQQCEEIVAKVENPQSFTCSLVGVDTVQDSRRHHIVKQVENQFDFEEVFRSEDIPNVLQSLYFKFSPVKQKKFPEFLGQSIEKITIGANLFLDCRSFVLKNLPLLQDVTVESNSFSNDPDLPYNLKVEFSQLPMLESIVIYDSSFQHFNYLSVCGRRGVNVRFRMPFLTFHHHRLSMFHRLD